MDHVRWENRPSLRRPVLVAAFEGWYDAADPASSAARCHVVDVFPVRVATEIEGAGRPRRPASKARPARGARRGALDV